MSARPLFRASVAHFARHTLVGTATLLAVPGVWASPAVPAPSSHPNPSRSNAQVVRPAQAGHAVPPTHALYLTFDADMTPAVLQRVQSGDARRWYDPAILDFLDENSIPATFYVAGLFAEAYPELVARIAADPRFAVGNHSYQHAAFASPCYGLKVLATDAEKLDDIRKAQEVLTRVAGRAPTRFRYPGLCRDAHDDELVRKAGLEVDESAIASGDAFNHDAASIVQEVLRRARDGRCIIFHFGGPNAPATLQALRVLVPALRAKSYAFGKKGP